MEGGEAVFIKWFLGQASVLRIISLYFVDWKKIIGI